MAKPTILFLFNSSTYAMEPWLEDGRFNVVTVDYNSTDHSDTERGARDPRAYYASIDLCGPMSYDAVLWYLNARGLEQPSLVVSFAPCTDLAVSGAKHFQRKLQENPNCQREAVMAARLAERFGCPYAVENPVSRLATLWRKPDHYWHPYHYGHLCPEGPHPEFPGIIPERDLYHKKSCLWVGNGFVCPPKVEPPVGLLEASEKDNPGWAKLGGKSARTKHIRSLTPRGFARAVYEANAEEVLSTRGLQIMLQFTDIQEVV